MSNFKDIILILLLFLAQNCYNTNDKSTFQTTNKSFSPQKQVINQSLQNLDKNDLILKLNDKNKIESINAISVLRDSSTIPYFIDFLNSKDNNLVSATAFAIGQINDPYYCNRLINTLNRKSLNDDAKEQIIIAVGKIGGKKELDKIIALNFSPNQVNLLNAQAIAFYHFAQRGIVSEKMFDKIFKIIASTSNISVKRTFSNCLTLGFNINLNKYFSTIKNEILKSKDEAYTFNLLLSLSHTSLNESFDFLKTQCQSKDKKLQYAAIKALSSFPYSKVKQVLWNFLLSGNEDLAATSARYFLIHGISKDAGEYLSISRKIKSWQARTYMLMSALEYTNDKKKIANLIISGYNVAENQYEKAALLKALSADPVQYKFVMNQALSASDKIISTAAIRSVLAMRMNPNFDKIANQIKQTNGIDLYTEFKVFFKEAMQKGDNAMIYYSTLAWQNPDFKMIDVFTNTYFITQAFNSLELPRDMKVYRKLCSFPELAQNKNCSNNLKIEKFQFDWKKITNIPSNQKVLIKTTKGNIKVTLDVNSAPATVYTFLSLINEGYYNNVYFYKKSPYKFVSTGGRRGDGWLDKNIPLVKEALYKNFETGSIAMNSIDDVYQSINWFITLSPTPEFDGKYTIFGKVTSGLDVLSKIQPGDKILKIKIL